jgi:dienelactone hydrolase
VNGNQGQRPSRGRALDFESCDDRILTTLVFVFNGNAYSQTQPDALTAFAARILETGGDQAIQLSTPNMDTPAAFDSVVEQVSNLSHGQPIGLVGFSAGGTLALRLAGVPKLNVKDVLADYSPPDLRDYLDYHRGDRFYRYVVGHVGFNPGVIDLLSGPSNTSAHVVTAYGLSDHNVVASASTASFQRDFPQGHVYYYPGGHGVSITASMPALEDFLAHL